MKTVSEHMSTDGELHSVVLWYPKTKKWVVRCYFKSKEVDEQIFPTEYEAEDCAEDFVLQVDKREEDSDTEDTGEE